MKARSRILAGTAAHLALMRGVDQMAGLLRPTLGPLPRTVAIGRLTSFSLGPEVLDSGAIIARRTLQLADPFEDMGAMLIRHAAWRVYERAGDGSATAGVLAQSLLRSGMRFVAAGFNPLELRAGLQLGLEVAIEELRGLARPIDGPPEIARVIAGNLGSPNRRDVADMIGEVVDAVGPDGSIVVENAQGTQTVCEYIDGVRWNEGFVSTFLLRPDEATTSRMLDPRVLVTGYVLEKAEQLVPVLEACVSAGDRNLFIVAPEVRDSAVGVLVTNREKGILERVVAVKAPSFGDQRAAILEDIAAITGGRCISEQCGDRLAEVTASDLGRARQAWATRTAFGILGGVGDKAALRQRIIQARAELENTAASDVYTLNLLQERIGRLSGSAAIIRVGAPSPPEQQELKLRVEAAVRSARAALRDGVVPGGGGALVACARRLAGLESDSLGVKALAEALCEPMRAIVRNAGIESAPIIDRARRNGEVFDVLHQEWVDPWHSGILDPLTVTQAALEASVSVAMTALTSDVLVRRKRPPTAVEP
jgi:chaperonin GroEL